MLRLFVLESSLPSSYFVVGLEVPATESHVGLVFQHQRPFVRRDLEREQQYPAEIQALADGVRSFAIVPLVVRARCIGTLAVASTRIGQYSEADVAFLQEVAGQRAARRCPTRCCYRGRGARSSARRWIDSRRTTAPCCCCAT